MYNKKVVDRCLGDFPCIKLPPQNILTRLEERQIAIDSPAQFYHRQRAFYQCVVPNYTEKFVQIPPIFFRKFFPNGKQILGFSNDQKSVLIYDFLGSSASQGLYDSNNTDENVRRLLFNKFFRLRHNIRIPENNGLLNHEFTLFTDDCTKIIIGAAGAMAEDPHPDIFHTSEDASTNMRYNLEDYNLFIIDVRGGVISDNRSFRCDKIQLAHNQGVSLCGSLFAVLSIHHQTIHLFEISNGTFVPMQEIGRFCYPDDELIYSEARYEPLGNPQGNRQYQPYHEKWFNSLKQRLLVFIFKREESLCTSTNRKPLFNFYANFDILASLRLWKIQLLGNTRLLLRYMREDIVAPRQTDPATQPALIALYDIQTTKILAVYENTSEELLKIYERDADSFRAPVSHPLSCDVSSVSNNVYARALHMKFKQTITNVKYGGRVEATRRLLGQLPVCSQSHCSSPYLDLALFNYDDKWVSPVERPKPCGDSPIRFYSRSGGLLSFTLETPLPPALLELPVTRRLVTYIFHPYEPFIISIQKTSTSDYVVCFHFRNNARQLS